MNFHFLTLFPEVVAPYMTAGILGKAQESGLISFFSHQLRDYADNKHKSVDDRPYGGGSGMVFRPEVVVAAVKDIKAKYSIERVVMLSPRGVLFSHVQAQRLQKFSSLLFICGRYEGVDERAIQLVVDEEISIGDYVVSGGELPALIVADAISRLVPGVIGNEEATLQESHVDGLLEYPHYTRPAEFEGLKVPEVLLSGHHESIRQWRREESLKITQKNRPDLLKKGRE